ncbi:prepilin-type N-terminal cleavage/methylation domain-containing protein [Acanthopleuribacter pedis]|uniref:Prepilin-type N-terminal cleavage/methylation domain-containing protein n=1 Tax=Acanthopleuribacter pedis TaxID=442870 RepID=A0A8J7QIX6_9BACT|nr:prepilin-type N-terminal cleavage/methylation domain-containing protein [Acanthopleuribacter pedis]MBO1319045.1 prepilin-type N-terminal cleavage/methylation domain-containing protein [Acanthopleuribacter pedis]
MKVSTKIRSSTVRAGARGHAGFTLLEALAALAILGISLVVLLRSQTLSISNVTQIQRYERGVFITENNLHWTFLDLNEADQWQDYQDVSGQDGDYKWRVSIQPVDMALQFDNPVVMLRVVATTTWEEGAADRNYTLETWYLWGEEQ